MTKAQDNKRKDRKNGARQNEVSQFGISPLLNDLSSYPANEKALREKQSKELIAYITGRNEGYEQGKKDAEHDMELKNIY